jgi:hypothetical protein
MTLTLLGTNLRNAVLRQCRIRRIFYDGAEFRSHVIPNVSEARPEAGPKGIPETLNSRQPRGDKV